jgi:hypothetical protein
MSRLLAEKLLYLSMAVSGMDALNTAMFLRRTAIGGERS